MIRGEELDLREGLVYDPAIKGGDSNFWKGDTINVPVDTGAAGAPVFLQFNAKSASSYSEYLYGDFEFNVQVDSLSPDSNDSEKYWGLRNLNDTLQRGAMYFEMRYDTVTGQDTATTRPLRAVMVDEAGTIQRKNITFDTLWNNTRVRYRMLWESGGGTFLINDTVYATLGDRASGIGFFGAITTFQVNTSIPQALRISNRTADSMDVSLITIRNARKVI